MLIKLNFKLCVFNRIEKMKLKSGGGRCLLPLLLIAFTLASIASFTIQTKKKSTDVSSKDFTPAPHHHDKDTSTTKKSALFKKCDPCPIGVHCVPHIQCPAHVTMKKIERPQTCELKGGSHGLCCTTGQNHSSK